MRDPAARLSFEESILVRHLTLPIDKEDFLQSALARRWVQLEWIIPFTILDSRTVVSPRLCFVSYPFEWCDAQLHEAARLTLRLQQEAVAAGYDLKDASAWNVLYCGTQPIFCDLLSFVPLQLRKWWAMGQFCRHFVAPLAVSRHRGLRAFRTFRAWRDGMPPDVSRAVLGLSRFRTRYWPLLAGAGDRDVNRVAMPVESMPKNKPPGDDLRRFRTALLAALSWMMASLEPGRSLAAHRSRWDGYAERREHYARESLIRKRDGVSAWIERLKPDWVADLGCNTGEFSELALKHGAHVVALDADHASVQRLFQRMPGCRKLFPVVVDIDDPVGGRGWAGEEFAGLMQRLEKRFDLVMMLALIHHLAIASAVPLRAIANFCARCTKAWLIVELIDESDVRLKNLCEQRGRAAIEFSLQHQQEAFAAAGFQLVDQLSLSPTPRLLVLYRHSA